MTHIYSEALGLYSFNPSQLFFHGTKLALFPEVICVPLAVLFSSNMIDKDSDLARDNVAHTPWQLPLLELT